MVKYQTISQKRSRLTASLEKLEYLPILVPKCPHDNGSAKGPLKTSRHPLLSLTRPGVLGQLLWRPLWAWSCQAVSCAMEVSWHPPKPRRMPPLAILKQQCTGDPPLALKRTNLLLRAERTEFLGSTDLWESTHTPTIIPTPLPCCFCAEPEGSGTQRPERGLDGKSETVPLAPVSCSQHLLSLLPPSTQEKLQCQKSHTPQSIWHCCFAQQQLM